MKPADPVCPACREVVYAGEEFCEACGSRLGPDPVPARVPTRGGGRACAGCGADAVDADGYCERCGLKQPAPRDRVELEIAAGRAAGVSDRGRRHSRNEDYLALTEHPAGFATVVCDGVGSSPDPDRASLAAAETGGAALAERLAAGDDPADATRAALLRAGDAVAALAPSPAEAPSCTYVSAVTGPGTVTVGWVGDSRAYWLAADGSVADGDGGDVLGPSRQLTADDSWAAIMVARGALTEAEAEAHPNAHVITGWLGADAEQLDPHVRTFAVDRPGTVLVCSDGLWNYLPAAGGLAAVAGDAAAAPLDAARALVRHALEAGGRDNITVTLLPVTAGNGAPA